MGGDERVLCVERKWLPAAWLGHETALAFTWPGFSKTMATIPLVYRERRLVEHDRAWKQLIPFLVVQAWDGARTGCYRRHGSETRLHDRMSVGVGGHVSSIDAGGPMTSLADALQCGIRRELEEEFTVLDGVAKSQFVGIINEQLSPVGEAHLGLVYRLPVTDPDKLKAGPELADFRWMETRRVHTLPLELWSRLALRLVADGLAIGNHGLTGVVRSPD